MKHKTWWVLLALGLVGVPLQAREVVIATVNNAHMLTLQRLTPHFERAHPGIRLKWVTLEEGSLRQQVSRDMATHAGRFDVVTIGLLEAPIWASRGWLLPIPTPPAYEVDDLLPPIRQGLSWKGQLMAAPFYGESSMTLARSDLLAAKGLTLPEQPTWAQVRELAAQLHDPAKGVYGICLRGRAGWGENITVLSTMVNTHGGQWFDMAWRPQIDSPAWRTALSVYLDLMTRFGPPGAAANGYNENLTLFSQGKCALWVDATVAGGYVNRPAVSKVAGKVAFARAPVGSHPKGQAWLWSWALAVPKTTRDAEAAQTFVRWATSRGYVDLVARTEGWAAVPSGTRLSTYAHPAFQRANPHARIEAQAIGAANMGDPTVPPSPYVGIQFVAIPEFQSIGTAVGQEIAPLLTEPHKLSRVLARSQRMVQRKMREVGYGPDGVPEPSALPRK